MSAIRQVALREVAQIERDIVDATAIDNGTLYVGLENIESGGRLVNVRPVDAGELQSSKFAFSGRHLLYGKLRPYLAKIARPDFEGICSTDILPVLPGPDLDRGYLAWLLLSPEMVARANSRASGANLPRLSPNALAELQIPLPALPEQRRIAEILDKADALRAKRRAALAQLDTLTQSIFLDMFGDPIVNDHSWPVFPIGKLEIYISDGNYSSKYPTSDEFVDSGIPFIRANNLRDMTVVEDDLRFISPAKHRELQKGHLVEGDVLITTRGEIGNIAIVPMPFHDANINAQIVLLRPNSKQIDSHYLAYLLNLPSMKLRLQSYQNGVALKQLPIRQLVRVPIPLPPIDLQREYALRIGVVEKLRATQRMTQTTTGDLFAVLQNRAFRGGLPSERRLAITA